MIKPRFIRLCIIVALFLSMLCGCLSNTSSNKNANQSPPIEDTGTIGSTPKEATQPTEDKNPNITDSNDIAPDNTATDNSAIDSVNTPTEVKTATNIQLVTDKNTAAKGEIIKVELTVNNVQKLAAYQVNIKYDPSVLQAVDPDTGKPLANDESPKDGNILVNTDYGLIPLNNHRIENGILNFGKSYLNYNKYKSDGNPEHTGVLAIIGFKVLEEKSTAIAFEDTDSMSGAISGTFLFDWDGNPLTNYTVTQPDHIN